jgi:methylmalonyl-CoA mutase C-terminal domain/subunit
MPRKIRVLVGKPGLDGHDRGAKVVAAALRDAGMEVIYTGLHQSPEQIVEAAIQEDVDVVALSILSGAHMTQVPAVARLMRERGLGDRLLTGGGIIPPEDMASLAKAGVGRLFGPGTSTQEIAAYVRDWFAKARTGDGAIPRPAKKPSMASRKPAARTKTTARARVVSRLPKTAPARGTPPKARRKGSPRPPAMPARRGRSTSAKARPAAKRQRSRRG